MILTYCYRILPTKRQHRALDEILEGQRQLYNAGLEERIDAYRKRGIARTYFDQSQALTEWRHSDAAAAALPLTLQRWTLKRLDDAYQAFFRRLKTGERRPGFPRFRGKGRFNTFGFNEFRGIHFANRGLRFKGMPGRLRIHLHRPLPEDGSIRSCRFQRDTKGWRVAFAIALPEVLPRKGDRTVGVDLGISTFAALSDGGFIPSLRAALRAERRLRVAQRALARKARPSGGWRKARKEVALCHAATARARANHLHQASARLLRDYDVIVVERLNVKGLAGSFLAKHVRDASWAKFLSMLRYKAECAGGRTIEVDPYCTSQECSNCGMKVPKELGDRHHECAHCGLMTDRDLNAARNILDRAGVGPGLRNVASCGMRAGGNIGQA